MIGLLLLLIPVCCFAPGFWVVRKLRWTPLETLAASVGLSLVVVYLVALGIHWAHLPWALSWGLSAVSLAALVASRRELAVLLRRVTVRRALRWFGVLFAANLLMLAVIRHYTGGLWCCDWYEHYERALWFLDFGPVEHRFINIYLLPARPPLMNLVTAFFMAQAGRSFSAFQVVCAFLNLIVFLPCVLLARHLAPRGARQTALIAILFALNPMITENAQFTWTKAATSFFVVLAVALYLTGWRKADPVRTGAAFLSLSAGILVHYSAGPFTVFLALHFALYVLWCRKGALRRLGELAGIVLPSAALLGTWAAYALSRFGLEGTLLANSVARDSKGMSFADILEKTGGNIVDSIIPYALRSQASVTVNGDTLRRVVDGAFYTYQVNLPFAIGSVGGVLALALLVRSLWPGRGGLPGRVPLFWLLLVLFTGVLGIATHGARDHYGVAHVGLQPLIAIAIAFVAANLPSVPKMLRGLLLGGLALDFVFGIAIHLYMESQVENWATDGNLALKKAGNLDRVYLGDVLARASRPLLVLGLMVALALLFYAYWAMARLPESPWRRRHRHVIAPGS
ncbi:MAG: hypothetical protein HY901_02070 [Deltaproteobacteria bacterium]|nr:hypothetical protein [Deltaproteobacteria bacterium]